MADNKIVEEIFKTIDIITTHKLNSTEYLYTEDCLVVSTTSDPFLYRVLHEGQEYDAYAPLGEQYSLGQAVVVLFTDYSKISRKIILYGDPIKTGGRVLSPLTFKSSSADVLNIQTGSTSSYLEKFYYNDSPIGGISVNSSGNGVVYATSSDYRLKSDIYPLNNNLDRVNSLNPVSWIWNNSGATGEGFLAHEIQEVIPYAVVGEKDQVDKHKNPIYQAVDLSKVVPVLVGAIKELTLEIEQIKLQLESLKGG